MTRWLIINLFVLILSVSLPDIAVGGGWKKENIERLINIVSKSAIEGDIDAEGWKEEMEKYSSLQSYDIGFGAWVYMRKQKIGSDIIHTGIVVYENKILKAEIWIEGSLSELNEILLADTELNQSFNKYFTQLFQTYYAQGAIYFYEYSNKKMWEEYTAVVDNKLGKQKKVNIKGVEKEYTLLMNPAIVFKMEEDMSADYAPVNAARKLIDSGKKDCIINIIKGYSLTGRAYGIQALLEMMWAGKYQMTEEERVLVMSVINMNLVVMERETGNEVKLKKYVREFITKNAPEK